MNDPDELEWLGEAEPAPDQWRAYNPDGTRMSPRIHFLMRLRTGGLIEEPRWDIWLDALQERGWVEARVEVSLSPKGPIIGHGVWLKRWHLSALGRKLWRPIYETYFERHQPPPPPPPPQATVSYDGTNWDRVAQAQETLDALIEGAEEDGEDVVDEHTRELIAGLVDRARRSRAIARFFASADRGPASSGADENED